MRQLTLETLFVAPQRTHKDQRTENGLEVYDLFCGAGGFSCGARDAGCRVVFACDADADALDTHARNHPSTKHVQITLPSALPLPTDGRPFHLHASPPCQKFSGINKRSRTPGDKLNAQYIVEWYLNLAVSCMATSWSMEQVACAETLSIVKNANKEHGDLLDYDVFHLSKLGVPQSRKRLVAGSPSVINRLRHAQHVLVNKARASVRSAIAKPRGTHVRSSIAWKTKKKTKSKYVYTRASISDFCRSIDDVAPTVVASQLMWVTPSGTGGWCSILTPKERAALQTFPSNYKWPARMAVACRQIANAVPPLVAQLMMGKDMGTRNRLD